MNDTAKQPFVGHFYCVTCYSTYRITIPADLVSRPVVEKRSTKTTSWELGRSLRVPVGGTLQNGHQIAITSRGLFQYNMPPGHSGLPLPFEEVPGIFRGTAITRTSLIVGLFLDRRAAEECYSVSIGKLEESFKPKWWFDTRQVLLTIGTEHPLVVISISQSKFEIPRFLWSESEPLPFVELSKGD